MRPTGTTKELERRRLRAVELVLDGNSSAEVAEMVGCKPRAVNGWMQRYRQGGPGALAGKAHPGRPCRLDPSQLRTLREHMIQGAKAHGFATNLWTFQRIVRVIDQLFGVHYHPGSMSRFLHNLGARRRRPRLVPKERNEAEIRRWIREEFPRIKKSSSRPRAI